MSVCIARCSIWVIDNKRNSYDKGEQKDGLTLHYAQHYQPDLRGGFFNHRWMEFGVLVTAEFGNNYWANGDETEFELERADIERYIEILMEHPDNPNGYFIGGGEPLSNREVADVFREILKSDDNTIHLQWF